MKSVTSGTASGCLIWVVVFGFLATCLCPLAMMAGSLTTYAQNGPAVAVMERLLCPAGSAGEIDTFATTTTDEFGTQQPATGFEMQCVNADGTIVRDPSPDYAFFWVGMVGVGGLILAGLIALLLAAPVGAFFARRAAGR